MSSAVSKMPEQSEPPNNGEPTQALVRQEEDVRVARVEQHQELTVAQVVAHVHKVREVMDEVMEDGKHYGKVPGVDKPFLYKAGAEKLLLTFRLNPEIRVTKHEISGVSDVSGHREYEVICTIRHIVTGAIWGQGVGVASTLESKAA